MYPVVVQDGEVHLTIPDLSARDSGLATVKPSTLKENEFRASELAPGHTRLVRVDGQAVAVYNVDGAFFATQEECTHAGGPLSEGDLDGCVITCPLHGSRFDVTTGKVVRGPADESLKTFRVTMEGEIGRVESS
jgi:nitrite reductase/ring-hydroxylating ferredoxin subunit